MCYHSSYRAIEQYFHVVHYYFTVLTELTIMDETRSDHSNENCWTTGIFVSFGAGVFFGIIFPK